MKATHNYGPGSGSGGGGGGGGAATITRLHQPAIQNFDWTTFLWSFETGVMTQAMNANARMYTWLYATEATRITDVRIRVTSASSTGTARIGIATLGDDWQPVALVADWGTVSTASTGNKDITGLTTDIDAGWYCVLVELDEGCSLMAYRGSSGPAVPFWNSASVLSNLIWSETTGITPGAFADPPGDWAVQKNANGQNHVHFTIFKTQDQP